MKISILIFLIALNSSLGFPKTISGQLFDASDEQPVSVLKVFLNNQIIAVTDGNGYFEISNAHFGKNNEIHFVQLGYKKLSITNITEDSMGNIELDSIFVFPSPTIAMGCYFGKNPLVKLKRKLRAKKRAKINRKFENTILPHLVQKKRLNYLGIEYQYLLRKESNENEITILVVMNK